VLRAFAGSVTPFGRASGPPPLLGFKIVPWAAIPDLLLYNKLYMGGRGLKRFCPTLDASPGWGKNLPYSVASYGSAVAEVQGGARVAPQQSPVNQEYSTRCRASIAVRALG